MIKFFPESALVQLEFEKIKSLLGALCKTDYGKEKAASLRIHTRKEYIDLELQQTHEFKLILQTAQYFPGDFPINLGRELKLLGIPGAVLSGEDFMNIRRLADTLQQIFRWFDPEKRIAYPALTRVIEDTYYEKAIIACIDEVLDENGHVKDNASEALMAIRMSLYRKRNELRKVFDRVLSKLNKAGYVADIEESFLNGRRVVALYAEQKRQVKGILHGESDTRRTAFVEPEETIELNNEVFSLENEEKKEVYRILRELTSRLSVYAALLKTYHNILGEFDFIYGKAKLAADVHGNLPQVVDRALVHLVQAYHPLLYLYNQRDKKPTIPTNISLDEKNRILVVSGPNAGGKTVTLKTVGLLQLMMQAGLLVPVHPNTQMGIFKQIMIHIGDTQSLEFDLSTYSSHLKNMKYFMENANGKTLFFIDELGSGSDPNLGGAFAEVILEELCRKHSMGIVTTHYLNLKIMANKTPGIINGAMAFDEQSLLPLFRLMVGKPGSSYTFSIAERIGLDKKLIERARQLVDKDHFKLDKLLNRTEQDLQKIDTEKKELQKLMKENERLKKEMEQLMDREKHRQQVELLKHQNQVSESRISYLKDMERKLKQVLFDWRKAETAEEKTTVMKQMHLLLSNQQKQQSAEKVQKKIDKRYEETGAAITPGTKVLMRKNHKVGEVLEIRGKKAIVKLGMLPITIDIDQLVAVKDKPAPEEAS